MMRLLIYDESGALNGFFDVSLDFTLMEIEAVVAKNETCKLMKITL